MIDNARNPWYNTFGQFHNPMRGKFGGEPNSLNKIIG